MTQVRQSWGIVATIRAPLDDILRFAAHHIDLGADQLYLFLDEPDPKAVRVLRDHPKVEIRVCNEAYWQRRERERPEKHQVRQSFNANFIYGQTKLDWLAHIDVDEFLWPTSTVGELLGAIPTDIPAVRVLPIEALAGGGDMYKTRLPKGSDGLALGEVIYPKYGGFVQGGFLSHIQGKLFVRSGLRNLKDRIHNLYQNNKLLPCDTEMAQIDLCHRHAPDWDHWLAHYRFRLERGSYQAGLTPNLPRERGGLNKFELLTWIEAENGLAGLRDFYDEISAADPNVLARLKEHGMLRHRPLDLDRKVAKHFPGTA